MTTRTDRPAVDRQKDPPELIRLDTAPGHLIRRAQQVNERVWQRLIRADLTSVQYGVLLALGARPDMDQRTAGQVMSLDKSSAADVLLRLVGRGLVARDRHPGDARRKLLRLTPAGRTTLFDAAPYVNQVQQELMSPLPPDGRAAFLELLRLVAYRGVPPAAPTESNHDGSIDGWPTVVPPVHLQTAPGHLIRRAQQVHTLLWGEHVGARLTSIQYVVLLGLHAAPDVDQRTLGQYTSLDKSTGGDILARMVGRGLIGRSRDLIDGRRNLLNLTAEGRRELFRHTPAVIQVQADLLKPLTEQQQHSFIRLIQQVCALRA